MVGENSDTDESCTSHCTESTNTRKANLRLKATLLAGLWGDRDAAVTDRETELVRLVSIPVNTVLHQPSKRRELNHNGVAQAAGHVQLQRLTLSFKEACLVREQNPPIPLKTVQPNTHLIFDLVTLHLVITQEKLR